MSETDLLQGRHLTTKSFPCSRPDPIKRERTEDPPAHRAGASDSPSRGRNDVQGCWENVGTSSLHQLLAEGIRFISQDRKAVESGHVGLEKGLNEEILTLTKKVCHASAFRRLRGGR